MDIRIERELQKIHFNNFQRAQDVNESLNDLVMDENLSVAEIGRI